MKRSPSPYDREIGKRIKQLRAERAVSSQVLAERLGVTRGAVGNWELGQGIKRDNLQKIAGEFGVSLDWLTGDHDDRGEEETVPLVGYVGAGAAAHFYGESQGELDRVKAPKDVTKDTVAVEIRGASLGELFEHWLVYYDEVRSPVTPDMIGKLCIVGLPDDRVLVKQIKRSRSPGVYHLLSNTEGPILDVEIVWAARVRSMEPR